MATESSENLFLEKLFANVVVESTLLHFDQEFCYLIPKNLALEICPGVGVFVPFGNSNKEVRGFVLSVFKEKFNKKNVKTIVKLSNDYRLSKEFIDLAKWMKKRYYCTFFDAIKTIFPSNIVHKKNSLRVFKISFNSPDVKLTKKQQDVYDLLKKFRSLSLKEIIYITGVTQYVVKSMIKKNIISYINLKERGNFDKNNLTSAKEKEIILTENQNLALKNILKDLKNSKRISLLYGVTGSGKTLVFVKLIKEIIKNGFSVIVMVPEIALTPQITSTFYEIFKNQVTLLHSSLSVKERLHNWEKAKNGEAKIVIGTRSAIFAPFDKIGLIIIDEEHETTYKSESTPRYHTREIAEFRCKYHKALLLLSSATPSIETFYKAKKGYYGFSKLTKRYGNSFLPTISVVDMLSETTADDNGIFSKYLVDALKKNLELKKQSILLLNRRGYSTFIICPLCKTVVACKNCSVSMTYHLANNRLMCHYCCSSSSLSNICPNCKEAQVKLSGVGTQKVEEALNKLIPYSSILRIDADSTARRFSLEDKLESFKKKKYDILIGTQMVAKGLDFKNVTLVGVISIDSILYSSDFRGYERTFSLITQVVGRSGRGEFPGKAVVQTFTPENPIIKLAATQNYESFYNSEIKMRKALLYPPFARICVIGFSGINQKNVIFASKLFCDTLIKNAKNNYKNLPLIVLGCSKAFIYKLRNKYRYKIVLKFRDCNDFRELMFNLKVDFLKNQKNKGINIFIDSNPSLVL
ncbi:MAG: primosomal protein N' [Oscillospiraceae bacterium]|jgi:primosomal protein N' (replication factor Y)|nr:primosomal protein N' [Oscillospiraceae bacterium]